MITEVLNHAEHPVFWSPEPACLCLACCNYRKMQEEITPELVDAYLATKADSDIIGTPGEHNDCLVFHALTWKFGSALESFSVGPGTIFWWDQDQCCHDMNTPEAITEIIILFDMLPSRPITKLEYLANVEAMKK